MATAGTIRRQENFFLAISQDFGQQSAVDVAMANADIDILLPLVEPTRPGREQNAETVYDCDGVHIIQNYINSELSRWLFAVQPSSKLFAGFMALAKGVASSFTGSYVNEVRTLTSAAASAGTFALAMTFEGRTGTTTQVAWNATAATLKAALEAMDRPIEAGDITSVTGTLAAGFVITFGGKLAGTDLPSFTIDEAALVGGTITQTNTTQGSGKTSIITRSTSTSLPLISFVTGYRGDTATYKKHYNQAVNQVTLNINKGQISSINVEIIGSTRFTLEPTFTVPACVNYDPIRAIDTRFNVDANWITGNTRSIVYTLNNQMATDGDAYPFDSIYMSTFVRGIRQLETLRFAVDGSETDDLYTWGYNRTEKAVLVYLGPPSNRAIVNIPVTELSLQAPDITYSANGDTILNLNGEPHKDATLATYSKVDYLENSSTPFLGT